MAKVYHANGERADHETPPALFWLIARELSLGLDVAATAATAKTAEYFTPDEDGLAQDWGRARWWLNPPYGRRFRIQEWLAKADQEGQRGHVGAALVPVRTGTSWWWEYVAGWEVRFLLGRLRFWQDGRPIAWPAGFDSAVVIYGRRFNVREPAHEYLDWRTRFRSTFPHDLRQVPDQALDQLRITPARLEPGSRWWTTEWAAELVEPWPAPDRQAAASRRKPDPAAELA